MSTHLLLGAFTLCIIISLGFFHRRGYSMKSLFGMMGKGLMETKVIFAVILLMGVAIAIWMASGIVPALVSYGLLYLNGPNFILVAFFITLLVASFMGTAVGTISTIGIALIAVGSSLGAYKPLLMGAIVSAAFVADRISPVSSMMNLTLKITEVEYKTYLKKTMGTLLPALTVSGIAYYFLGRMHPIVANSATVNEFRMKIGSIYYISPYLLLVPVAIIVMAALGLKVVENLAIGAVIGGLISVFVQKITALNLIKAVFFGYVLESPMADMNRVFHGGGIVPMLEVICIVMGAISFSGILEGTHVVEPFIKKVVNGSTDKRYIATVTAGMGMSLTAITCDQTVGILFMGKYMRPYFEKTGLGNTRLARLISDTGTTVAPMVPWNINALIICAFTGVSVVSFLQYMVLCYVTPIISLGAIFIRKD